MEPFELGGNADAETVVLDGRHRNRHTHRGPRDRAQGQSGGRRSRRRVHRPLLLIAAVFAISFIIKMIILNATAPTAPAGDESGSTAPSSVTAPDGNASDARLANLRQTLDEAGYRDVNFRLNGDVLEVWGTVSDELDRVEVQALIFRSTGITLLDENLRVSNTYAEP
jgi:hypothetical protein